MIACEILETLRKQGVILEARGNRLYVDAPKGKLSDNERAVLAAHKSEILALLSEDNVSNSEKACPQCGDTLIVEEQDEWVYLDCPKDHYAAIGPVGKRDVENTERMQM